jgi:hypothetical protein
MLDTSKFFEAFDKAGFLKPALWTPSSGLPGAGIQQSAQVRYRQPSADVLAGDAFAEAYSISYPSTVFPGLRRGETVTVDGVQFKLREDPRRELDGSRCLAQLSKF